MVAADCGPPSVFLNGTVSYQDTTEESEAHYRSSSEQPPAAVTKAYFLFLSMSFDWSTLLC